MAFGLLRPVTDSKPPSLFLFSRRGPSFWDLDARRGPLRAPCSGDPGRAVDDYRYFIMEGTTLWFLPSDDPAFVTAMLPTVTYLRGAPFSPGELPAIGAHIVGQSRAAWAEGRRPWLPGWYPPPPPDARYDNHDYALVMMHSDAFVRMFGLRRMAEFVRAFVREEIPPHGGDPGLP